MSSHDRGAIAPDATPNHQRTMARLREGLQRLGDLPIFSTSINRVRRVSSDPKSDAMAVTQEILKDANLSTKLLRLGNSAYYNRGVGKISAVSRAVIMLGFETVRNVTLTLKLIESFQNANPAVDMSRMLVKSYLAAGFVRELAERCGVKDIEESYVCALLYSLGETTVAYVLPEEYVDIKRLIADGRSPAAAENAVLGTSVHLISQDLAASWEFPPSVVSTMAPPPESPCTAKDRVSFNRSIAALSHRLLENLYSDARTGNDLAETLERLSKTTGLNDGAVEHYLGESFRQSCALAAEYGLDKQLLKPPLGGAEATLRNKWARQFSFLASRGEPAAPPEVDAPATIIAPASDSEPEQGRDQRTADPLALRVDPGLQLKMIQEITDLIANSARLSDVFAKVVEGLHRGAGFERALLCLVTPDRRRYVGRLAAGSGHDALREYFAFPIKTDDDLFSRILSQGGELTVDDTAAAEWGNLLPADFVKMTGADSFIVAALRFQDKPVGFFYADCAVSRRAIDKEARRSMLQFVTQARLALRLCS